jgi:polysaccharide deacetylase 2 family uncharacterized protein YibQ
LAPDDLDKPLGSKQSARSPARKLPVLPLTAGALAAAIAAALGWIVLVDNPLGGEPMARVALGGPPEKFDKPGAGQGVKVEAPRTAEKTPSGEQTVTIIDGKSGTRTTVAVKSGDEPGESAVGTAPPADDRLTEPSRHGPIPRVAADGKRALEAYARVVPAAARKGPQIAIVISGLGIGATTTGEALAKLPNATTLAFTPYGTELPRWIAKARGAGHEILLQIPMEPFDYPDNDPGPQTLLSTLTAAQNVDRLHWFMSRAQGYVGVTNLMGARFTSSEPAFSPIIADVGQRGLLYFDDGASPRSVTHKVAANSKAPFLKADLVIDIKANWSDIDAALEKLERLAVDQGFAVGSANALPVTIERIARWAKEAESRGIRIVPLSAVAARSKQS